MWINKNFDQKSKFLEINWINLQRIVKCLKNLGYQDKICTKYRKPFSKKISPTLGGITTGRLYILW